MNPQTFDLTGHTAAVRSVRAEMDAGNTAGARDALERIKAESPEKYREVLAEIVQRYGIAP